jgi:hypothetical protein
MRAEHPTKNTMDFSRFINVASALTRTGHVQVNYFYEINGTNYDPLSDNTKYTVDIYAKIFHLH